MPRSVTPFPLLAGLVGVLLALVCPPASAAGPSATADALAAQMRLAGQGSGALAVDLDSGRRIYGLRAGVPRMPASVEKLYTSAAALRRLGPEGRLTTDVLARRPADGDGVVRGNLYLRGGGDPTFGALETNGLAQQLVTGGITAVRGRVVGDESLFDAVRGVPSSAFRLTSEVGPLSALTFERGRSGLSSPYWQARPASFAARAFTRALRHLGVEVARSARRGVTPAGAAPVAAWRSPPVSRLLRAMNQPSDNFLAEMLVKVLGARFRGEGSTAAGTAVMREELAELGLFPQVVDGSGLSRSDRTTPADVVALLAELGATPAFTGSLPVAGRHGTLSTRMRGTVAQDRCRAKTGTLRDVSALAGYCVTAGGGRVAYAFLMNHVNPWSARVLQDRMTIALARYRP